MKHPRGLWIGVVVAGLILTTASGRADELLDSPDEIDFLDDWGFFPPECKSGLESLFQTNSAIIKANEDEARFKLQLPIEQKKTAVAQAKTEEIRKELAEYDHTDESDFAQLQKQMSDPEAKLEDLIKLAQEYVWAYPTSPHLADAQKDLTDTQQKQANQSQAEKDAESARVAARAKILAHVKARDLNLAEWKAFLFNQSEVEVMGYLGPPDGQEDEYWLYTGDYTVDPDTQKKIGLRLNFNAGRVVNVLELFHQ